METIERSEAEKETSEHDKLRLGNRQKRGAQKPSKMLRVSQSGGCEEGL